MFVCLESCSLGKEKVNLKCELKQKSSCFSLLGEVLLPQLLGLFSLGTNDRNLGLGTSFNCFPLDIILLSYFCEFSFFLEIELVRGKAMVNT